MSTTLDTLNFTQSAGEALEASRILAEKVAEEQVKVAELIPSLSDEMLKRNLIAETEKTAAAEQLSTHEGALKIVGNLLNMLGETKQAYEQKLAAAGQGVPSGTNGQEKRASFVNDDLMAGGAVGSRAGLGEKRASDEAYIDSLGIRDKIDAIRNQ